MAEQTDRYTDIVEVLEGGVAFTNHYLRHNYRLLEVIPSARARTYPPEARGQGASHFIQRGALYVVGRPSTVPRAPAFQPQSDGHRRPPA